MFLYGAFVNDDDEPVPMAFWRAAVCANGFSEAGRASGCGAYDSVQVLDVSLRLCDQTPRRLAAQIVPPPKRSAPIVVDSSSVPPIRVHEVELAGLLRT
jgi:hypothetical protein